MADGVENTNTDATRVQTKLDVQTPAKGKKLSVLETHGYNIGRSIGSGAYATVKVCNDDHIMMVVREDEKYMG